MVARAALLGRAGRELQQGGISVLESREGLGKDLAELGLITDHIIDEKDTGARAAFSDRSAERDRFVKNLGVTFEKEPAVLALLHDERFLRFGIDEDRSCGGAEIVGAEVDDDEIVVAGGDIVGR